MNQQQTALEQSTVQITLHADAKPPFKKQYFILIAVIVLLLCTGVAAVFIPSFFSPKAVLLRAAKNTFSENNFPGFHTALTALQSGQYESSYSMALSDISFDTDMPNDNNSILTDSDRSYLNSLSFYMKGISLDSTAYADTSSGDFAVDMNISFLLKKYFTCSLYAGNNTLLFSMPELADGSVMIKADTLGRDYNASALPEFTGVTLPQDYQLTLMQGAEPFFEKFTADAMTVTELSDTDAFAEMNISSPFKASYYECRWKDSDVSVICMVDADSLITAASVENILFTESAVGDVPYAPKSMNFLFSKQDRQMDITAAVCGNADTPLLTLALTGTLSDELDVLDDSIALSYQFDSLTFSDSINGIHVTGYGGASVQRLQQPITPPSGERYEIFRMSKEELALFMEDIVNTWTKNNFSFFN